LYGLCIQYMDASRPVTGGEPAAIGDRVRAVAKRGD
jgi:hypothetical protein